MTKDIKKESLKRIDYFLIFLSLLFFFIAAICSTFTRSLWLDEGWTYLAINHNNITDVFNHVLKYEQSPPLFFILDFFSFKIFKNEISLRFVSIISNFSSSLLLFFFLSKILPNNNKNNKIILFSSIFFLLNSYVFFTSVSARPYSLLTLFCLIAGFSFYLGQRSMKDNKIKYLILFTIFMSLALWTHFIALIFFMSLFLFFLIFIRRNWKTLFCFLISFLSFFPYLFSFIKNRLDGVGSARDWANTPNIIDFFVVSLKLISHNIYLSVFCGIFILEIICFDLYFSKSFMKFFMKIHDFFDKNKEKCEKRYMIPRDFICTTKAFFFSKDKFDFSLFIKFVIFIPASVLIISFIISQKIPIFSMRYFVFLVPFISVFIIFYLFRLKNFYIKIFLAIIIYTQFMSSVYSNEDWQSVAHFIKNRNGDVIVHTPSIGSVLEFYKTENIKKFPDTIDFRDFKIDKNNLKEFEQVLNTGNNKKILVIGKGPYSHESINNLLVDFASKNCKKTEEKKEFASSVLFFFDC